MTLKDMLLKEHSKSQKDKIVRLIGNDPKRFSELVTVYLAGPYRVTQRAAWPLSECVIQHPSLVKPHLSKLIDYARKKEVHDAVKRNTVRLLQFVTIPKRLQGKTADMCFLFLSNPKEPIAVRVFAMTVLANLAHENRELKNEIIPLIEEQLPYASAGFRSRAAKVLINLRRL